MKTVLCLVGPTASGKTEIAEGLADQLPLRLISVDSMQVYRGLDIGTAKPEPSHRQHWAMLDLVEPGQDFSAGDYSRRVRDVVEQAWGQNQVPLLTGGTGLYFNICLNGIAKIPEIPKEIRKNIEKKLGQMGLDYLVREFREVDPVLAGRTDLKNSRRVCRALEVYEASGRPLSYWQAQGNIPTIAAEQVFLLGIKTPRDWLWDRIKRRVSTMMQKGWLNEVRSLKNTYGSQAILKTKAIGYAEVLQILEGNLKQAEAQERIEIATRQYAKRQETWFKKMDIKWFGSENASQAILNFIKKSL